MKNFKKILPHIQAFLCTIGIFTTIFLVMSLLIWLEQHRIPIISILGGLSVAGVIALVYILILDYFKNKN